MRLPVKLVSHDGKAELAAEVGVRSAVSGTAPHTLRKHWMIRRLVSVRGTQSLRSPLPASDEDVGGVSFIDVGSHQDTGKQFCPIVIQLSGIVIPYLLRVGSGGGCLAAGVVIIVLPHLDIGCEQLGMIKEKRIVEVEIIK